MNIIINGFHNKNFFPLVLRTIKRFDVKYLHYNYANSKLRIPSKVEAISHDFNDLIVGAYEYKEREIIPLDENLIEKMSGCETVTLRMMDRLPYNLSYDERKELYLKHLRYWNHILNMKKIDLFLSSAPPHEVFDYIIYCLCKLKKIPTIILFQTNISDTLTVIENLESNLVAIRLKYQQLLNKYKYVNESAIQLKGRFKRVFELNMGKKDPQLFYVQRQKPSHNIIKNLVMLFINLRFSRLLQLIKQPNLLIRSLTTYPLRIILDSELERFYRKNATLPNISKKYIYFPLHMQPESTTSPLAGAFVDQILIAQMISYYIPKDILIYVKEHPHQVAIGRSIPFYKELLKISNVRLIPTSFDSHILTNHSLAVATATGTAGLEALYRCKPVLMFGHNFYQYAKGVFQIKSNSDCQYAIKRILKDGFKPTIKDIKIFFKSLEDTTVEGYIDLDYKKDSHITDTISNRNIFNILSKEIKLACRI
jgi:hypothetical protein